VYQPTNTRVLDLGPFDNVKELQSVDFLARVLRDLNLSSYVGSPHMRKSGVRERFG
jgi:hypothetical protein